jgi:hypothetical protein
MSIFGLSENRIVRENSPFSSKQITYNQGTLRRAIFLYALVDEYFLANSDISWSSPAELY